MSQRLSITFEQLVARNKSLTEGNRVIHEVDVLVVGSGYGASVAAVRLAGAHSSEGGQLTLTVLERGREYLPGDFPEDLGMALRHVRIQPDPGLDRAPSVTGYEEGLFDFRGGQGVGLLVGNGLGGGSLINASVAEMPDPDHLASLPLPAAWRNYFSDQAFATDQDEVARLLGAEWPDKEPEDEGKYAALHRLGQALGGETVPARLTVSSHRGANAAGVYQDACLRCGNCVTGCNVGAKNSLDHNLLSLAVARGAKLVTGATVVSVRPASNATRRRWIAKVRRTRASRVENALQDGPELWEVAADHVILGAGSLGSTEILMRSRDMEELSLSPLLGTRFSTNGDGIATGFAQQMRVSPTGTPTQTASASIGPTIRGILRLRLDEQGRAVQHGGTPVAIEDGAVPYTLRHFFSESVVTAALFNRLGDGKLPARLRVAGSDGDLPDPLACSSDVIEHSQLLLLMGDDRARGRLVLRGKGALAAAVPEWPDAAANPALVRIDRCLAEQNLKAGFDGGQYVPNPGWRLLPEDAAGVMSGALPGGMTVSVHPLGGCAAADSAAEGVVDEAGRVFSGVDGTVHDGLYVMDGAVLPGATAVNPFMMISVMAWRAAGRLLEARKWRESDVNRVKADFSQRGPYPVARQTPGPVAIEFSERMSGDLSREPEWVRSLMCSQGDPTLHVRSTLSVADLDAWLEAPGETPLSGRVTLVSVDPLSGAEQPLSDWPNGTCEVRLLTRESGWRSAFRWLPLRACRAYGGRRMTDSISMRIGRTPPRHLYRNLKGFLSVARMQELGRLMHYRCKWEGLADRGLLITGSKLLAYRTGNRPVLEAMTVLDARVEIRSECRRHVIRRLSLKVNLLDIARDRPPRITAMPHLPAAIQSFARVGAFAARCILQTSFWEFGLDQIDAEQGARLREPDPTPLPVFDNSGTPTLPTAYALTVPVQERRPESVSIRLLHYSQPDQVGDPVVLLHGLAQGSRIFTTQLDENMASAMWRAGFDVWLVDYRLSNLVLPSLPDYDWDLDDIAKHDIPEALRFVHVHYKEQRPLRVFAHCVGATALTMAMLAGRLAQFNVSHVVMNAIHPWVMPALANNLRARLAGFLRDRLPGVLLDPRPSGRPGLLGDLFDRLAMALARYNEAGIEGMTSDAVCHEHAHHDLEQSRLIERLICDRMTVLYGRMWKHGNLDPRTHRDFREIIGPAPPAVYRQLYHLNRRERVTDRHGENAYLTADRLRTHWTAHTLLLHGEDSEVFNPQSARRSAAGLKAFLPAEVAVRLKCLPGFGHMDVIFARQAALEVYPRIVGFFGNSDREVFDAVMSSRDAPPEANITQTGPFIRGIRRTQARQWIVTLWLELSPYLTRSDLSLDVSPGVLKAHVRTADRGRRYQWVDIQMPLDDGSPLTLSFRAQPGTGIPNGGWSTRGWHRQGRYEIMDGNPYSNFLRSTDRSMETAVLDAPVVTCSLEGLTQKPWFKRLVNGGDGRFRFLAGSCRYPAQFMDAELSDEIYRGMLAQVEEGDGVDVVFLLGDQIYADATAGLTDSDDPEERYIERYRSAFGSPNFARLCASVPVHFAVDDHELDDQWSGEPSALSSKTQQAINIALDYQLRFPQPQTGSRLAYALPCPDEAACPVFVMDARFEREYRDGRNLGTARMIGQQQQSLLDEWLDQTRSFDGPKFIVSGVVLAPFERRALASTACIDLSDGSSWTEDGWAGYPATLAWLIRRLVERQVRQVVFVGGDQHLASVSRLKLHVGDQSIDAWHVVASGLYAPLPLASVQREEVVTVASVRVERDVSFEYDTTLLCHDYRHFVRVDAYRQDRQWQLKVCTCDAAGQVIHAPPPISL